MAQSATKPFSWGVVGTGPVSRKFAFGLAGCGHPASVGPVLSRDPGNARAFARKIGGRPVDTLDDLLSAAPDAVYVASPADLHEAHALAAISAGIPVLIEKPVALNAASAERIFQASEASGVFAMEALWTRFLPLVQRVKQELSAGSIGTVHGFEGSFMAAVRPGAGLRLFDPEAGGALLHRGIYPISLAHWLVGPVIGVDAVGAVGATGVDEDVSVALRHENGAISTVRASLRSTGRNSATVFGSEGRIEIDAPIWRPLNGRLLKSSPGEGMAARRRFERLREGPRWQMMNDRVIAPLRAWRGKPTVLRDLPRGNGYGYEADEVIRAVRDGRRGSEIMPLAESVEVMRIIDRARAQVLGAGA